jgi:hypothetical protein
MSSQLVHLNERPGFRKALSGRAVSMNANGPMAWAFGRRNVPNPAPLMQDVGPVGYIAKVAKAIVGSIVIDVINNVRLFVVGKKPSNSMRVVAFPFMRVGYVAILQRVADWLPGLPSRVRLQSVEQPGVRIVGDGISNRIRDCVGFHWASLPHKRKSRHI